MTFCLWKPLPHLPLPLHPADRTSITSRHCQNRAQKATPIEKRREERTEEDQSDRRLSFVSLPSLTFTTPLPHHLPLHPVTVTTFQPPRSALRCVPLPDGCFTFPLVLPQPKTHRVCLFNARSAGTSRRRSHISTFIQDNNIDIMLLTETWLRPAGDEAKIADLAPRSWSWSSPSPALQGGPAQKTGASSSS